MGHASLGRLDRFAHRRRLEPIADVPSAQFEAAYRAPPGESALAA